MTSLSVVVPVYNGALTIRELTSRLADVLSTLADEYELIYVEDNGRDNSWEIIQALASEYSWVHGTQFMRNYGQHNAVLYGIRAAKHEIIVTMDDDLQHPPEEIHRLLSKLEEGFDVVYGAPEKEQHGMLRNLASRITKLTLQKTMGVDAARNVSAFRIFRSQIRDAFVEFSGPFVSIDVLLSWGTSRFAAIKVRHNVRKAGISNYTIYKLLTHALNMITGFSTMPLQLASALGFIFTIFGLILLVYILAAYIIYGGSVPGFPFLASTIAIFSGVQLVMIGIIGEYLARMYHRTMDRPSYTVREQTPHN